MPVVAEASEPKGILIVRCVDMGNNLQTWLDNGGKMGKLICEKNWMDTPLGPVEDWPNSLRNILPIVMETRVPALICWGSELSMIYNDAYQRLLGDKSDALGSPFLKVWPEAEESIGPIIERTLSGESGFFEDRQLLTFMDRGRAPSWYDLYYSPVRDETGTIKGFMNISVDKTKHIRYQQDLQESKERYQTLFESIDEGFSIIEVLFDENNKPVDYKFLETNPAFYKHTGMKNVKGKRRRNLEPGMEEYWYEIFGDVVLNQEPIRFQRPARASNKFYDVYAFPFGRAENNKAAVLFSDISQRKNAEQALQDSEKHLRLATKAADMHFCEVNFANESIKWTQETEHPAGFPMPETFHDAKKLLHPDDKSRVLAVFERALKYNKDFEIEYRIVNPANDRIIWVYSAGVGIADSYGKASRVVSVTKNITERKITDRRDQFLMDLSNTLQKIGDPEKIMKTTVRMLGEHLRADRCTYAKVGVNEDSLDILGNYTHDNMPVMEGEAAMSDFGDIALKYMQQNKSFVTANVEQDHRISGDYAMAYSQNEIKAMICVPLYKDEQFVAKIAVHQREPREWSPEEVELVEAVTNDCWEAVERARVTRELQLMNKTLEERVRERTEALKTYQNQLRSLASELNRAEERERQRLASELHNNLGQLLVITKMGMDNIQKSTLPESISDEMEDLSDLLDNALTYTRELMSDLKPPPALDKENLTEVLDWVVKKMKKRGLEVTIVGGNRPMHISEEIRTTLRRCVRELLFNVLTHAGVKEARVIISYSPREVQVEVEDKGRGFNMKDKEPTPTDEGGFGLFNIRERMRWLGGKFKIISSPGNGTLATLNVPVEEELPVARSPGRDGEKSTASVEPDKQIELWKKIEVLLVDDHEMMRKGLRKLIEEEDDLNIIAEASDGIEAVELAHETSPDVIVMDVNLPGMDGIEATQKIASSKQDIRIIGLSLYDSQEVARDMKNAGAVSYLTKSDAFESLCATIRNSVQNMEK